jgi:hypothetical protein
MELFATAANDAAVLATTHEIFEYTAAKAMVAECRIKSADVNTDDGFWAFGFADALAATTMADTTGAITATDAALIYKLPDTTVYALHTEINGLQNRKGDGSASADAASTTSTIARSTTDWQTLRIEVIPRSSTIFEVRGYVDGVLMKDSGGVPIQHAVALGTSTELDFGVVVKSNHTSDLSVFIDYLYAAQLR